MQASCREREVAQADQRAAFARIARARRAVRSYEPSAPVDDRTLARLFELVVLAPSSFNLQHWRFVVVRDPERKRALRAAANGQAQVESAGAVVVVAGKLDAWRDAERINADASEEARRRVVAGTRKSYEGQERFQRDEAIRSASLAAMTLMHAATAAGLASGPMIGFDPEQVARLVELPEDVVPVMLVALGTQSGTPPARPFRLPPEEVVKLESFTGAGLAVRASGTEHTHANQEGKP
jgi:nitroreductase